MGDEDRALLRIDVVTLFPELFDAPLRLSVIGRAVERGILSVEVHDLREHGIGRHRRDRKSVV